MSAFDQISPKLKTFIRAYLKNQLNRALMLYGFFLMLGFLGLVAVEYFLYASSLGRLLMLICFLVYMVVLGILVCRKPLISFFSTDEIQKLKTAVNLLSARFPELKDRLQNVVDLNISSQTDQSIDHSILEAAIQQKIFEFKHINFFDAIPIKTTHRVLLLFLSFMTLLIASSIIAPQFIRDSTQRIVFFQRHFERPSPYAFKILSLPLQVEPYADYQLKVLSIGEAHPDRLLLDIDGWIHSMQRVHADTFLFTFKHVSKPLTFYFSHGSYRSQAYTLNLLLRPQIRSVQLKALYPEHTGLEDELINDVSQMNVPRGTILKWLVSTLHTERLHIQTASKLLEYPMVSDQSFSFKQTPTLDDVYKIYAQRSGYTSDTLMFALHLIDDAYPSLRVDLFQDSTLPKHRFFNLSLSDDYGFKDLKFVILKSLQQTTDTIEQIISISVGHKQQQLPFTYDFSPLLSPGSQLKFYFLLRDNDALSGHKTVSSEVFTLEEPTLVERREQMLEKSHAIERELKALAKQSKADEKRLDRLQEKLISDPKFNWEHKQIFEQILKSRLSTQQSLERLEKEMRLLRESQEKLDPEAELWLEKQKQLEELMQSLLDPETKALLESLQALLKQDIDKSALEQAMQQLDQNQSELKDQLDQNLSLFKNLEFERRVGESLAELSRFRDSLARAQETFAPLSQVDSLQSQFEQVQAHLDRMMEANQGLDDPYALQRQKEAEKKLGSHLEQASQREEDQRSEQRVDLEKAQQIAEQMVADLEQQMASSAEGRDAEDAQMIRRLLKALIAASQKQESLIELGKSTSVDMPAYQTLIREQSSLRQDLSMILDSLSSVARRQVLVARLIQEAVSSLRRLPAEVQVDLLAMNDVMYQRRQMTNPRALYRQQLAMTAMNDMSLLLAESLKQMEENASKGSGSCKQRKSGKGSSKPNMKELQKQLNDQISKLEQRMREGTKRSTREERSKMSEAFSKAAMQQEMLRRQLQEMAEALKRAKGQPDPQLQSIMEMMEQTERELVHKTISRNTLNRQQEILTRLLESDKAQKEREQEERREAIQGNDQFSAPSILWKKDTERRKQAEESLQRFLPELNLFYKRLSQEYFNPTR